MLLRPEVRLPVLLATGRARARRGGRGPALAGSASPSWPSWSRVAAVLPPLAAFAAWFAGWHAVRHTARLVALDPRSAADLALGEVRPATAALRPGRGAAERRRACSGRLALAAVAGLTGGLLVALLALTVPHTAVVARLGAVRAGAGRAVPAAGGSAVPEEAQQV